MGNENSFMVPWQCLSKYIPQIYPNQLIAHFVSSEQEIDIWENSYRKESTKQGFRFEACTAMPNKWTPSMGSASWTIDCPYIGGDKSMAFVVLDYNTRVTPYHVLFGHIGCLREISKYSDNISICVFNVGKINPIEWLHKGIPGEFFDYVVVSRIAGNSFDFKILMDVSVTKNRHGSHGKGFAKIDVPTIDTDINGEGDG